MLKESQFQELQQVLKRSELLNMLAETEIKNQVIFTDVELSRATRETFINKAITRKDIDFKKVCLLDEELNRIKIERDKLLDKLKHDIEEETKEQIKPILLELLNQQDKRYNSLCIEFQYEF